MSNYTQKAADLTHRLVSWASSDGSVGGLRRLMIGNGRWTGSRDTSVSIQRDTDCLKIHFGATEVKIPKDGYSHTSSLDTMRMLRGRICPSWDDPITDAEVAAQLMLFKN